MLEEDVSTIEAIMSELQEEEITSMKPILIFRAISSRIQPMNNNCKKSVEKIKKKENN